MGRVGLLAQGCLLFALRSLWCLSLLQSCFHKELRAKRLGFQTPSLCIFGSAGSAVKAANCLTEPNVPVPVAVLCKAHILRNLWAQLNACHSNGQPFLHPCCTFPFIAGNSLILTFALTNFSLRSSLLAVRYLHGKKQRPVKYFMRCILSIVCDILCGNNSSDLLAPNSSTVREWERKRVRVRERYVWQ